MRTIVLKISVAALMLFGCSGGSPIVIENVVEVPDAGSPITSVDAGGTVDANIAIDASRTPDAGHDVDAAPACVAYPNAVGTSTTCTPLGPTTECADACGGYPYEYECSGNAGDMTGPAGVLSVVVAAVGGFPAPQGRFCGSTNVCTQNTYVGDVCTSSNGYKPPDSLHTSGWICPSGYAFDPNASCRGAFALSSTPADDTPECCSTDTAKP